MRMFNFAPQKPFGPLTFLAQLESDMREAGRSKKSIDKFKKYFGNPDPQSLYAQNILADLQANRYASESVKRHITRMRDFQTKCYAQLKVSDFAPKKLSNLRKLDLGNDQLAALPGEIGQLTNLQKLFLHNNQLAALPGEIGQLTSLQVLWLHNNQLDALPDEIWQLPNLQILKLDHNRLAALPGEIGRLTNLQILDLRNNLLAALPGEIGQLTNVQTLGLDNNQLAALPDEIWQLPNLQTLSLCNNQFTTVPRTWLNLPERIEINLQGNPLPDAEIIAVRNELDQRRARGQVTPQFSLPAIAAERENALRYTFKELALEEDNPAYSRFRRLFQRGEGSSGTKEVGSTSESAGQRPVSRKQIKRYVRSAYKALRYYHGTNKASLDSIRAKGMRVWMKRPGPTDIGLNEATQSQGAVQRARQHNYFATVKGAAKSYAMIAGVSNTRDWSPKAGDDGVPKVGRLFRTADFPKFEKDTDFPIPVSFLNPLYRTRSDIPAHAVRQEKGDDRYSEEILTALQKHIEDKFKVSLSLQEIKGSLVDDVESDSDDEFR